MRTRRLWVLLAVATVAAAAGIAAAAPSLEGTSTATASQKRGKKIPLKDARLKFEINATDGDGGVQVFIDAEPWKEMSIVAPDGRTILVAQTSGRLARQGGTELFMESGEPPFSELPLAKLLERWPQGTYRIRGEAANGDPYVGSAALTHDLPAGPELVSPLTGSAPQNPASTTVSWRPVGAPNGSPIVGYQVLVVQPSTGIRALPKIVLDVMMPPSATSMLIPPGFLAPGTEYEWEVLAIERGGNQTLSSSTFTTAG